MPLARATHEEYVMRFWSKVNKRGRWSVVNGRRSRCWEYVAGLNSDGYGAFWMNGSTRRAHKLAYEWASGPVPDGLTLDHLCCNKPCVRPLHQEPVTHKVNILRSDTTPSSLNARKTTCPKGHPYDGFNRKGARTCSECSRAYHRNYARQQYGIDSSRCRAKSAEYYKRNRELIRVRSRRSHCKHGHLLHDGSVIIKANGYRQCALCEPARLAAIRLYHQLRKKGV